jgi:hypothetical protein
VPRYMRQAGQAHPDQAVARPRRADQGSAPALTRPRRPCGPHGLPVGPALGHDLGRLCVSPPARRTGAHAPGDHDRDTRLEPGRRGRIGPRNRDGGRGLALVTDGELEAEELVAGRQDPGFGWAGQGAGEQDEVHGAPSDGRGARQRRAPTGEAAGTPRRYRGGTTPSRNGRRRARDRCSGQRSARARRRASAGQVHHGDPVRTSPQVVVTGPLREREALLEQADGPAVVPLVREGAGGHDPTLRHQLGAGRRRLELPPELVHLGVVVQGPVAVREHRVLLGRVGEDVEGLELVRRLAPFPLAVEGEPVELPDRGRAGRVGGFFGMRRQNARPRTPRRILQPPSNFATFVLPPPGLGARRLDLDLSRPAWARRCGTTSGGLLGLDRQVSSRSLFSSQASRCAGRQGPDRLRGGRRPKPRGGCQMAPDSADGDGGLDGGTQAPTPPWSPRGRRPPLRPCARKPHLRRRGVVARPRAPDQADVGRRCPDGRTRTPPALRLPSRPVRPSADRPQTRAPAAGTACPGATRQARAQTLRGSGPIVTPTSGRTAPTR